jgi:hypothetical protein
MTRPTPAGRTSVASPDKDCPACGRRFGCGSGGGDCWCQSLELGPEVLGRVLALASDCLCPNCLAGCARGEDGIREGPCRRSASSGLVLLPLATSVSLRKRTETNSAGFGRLAAAWEPLTGMAVAGCQIREGRSAHSPATGASA